jgi:hypothetical protein
MPDLPEGVHHLSVLPRLPPQPQYLDLVGQPTDVMIPEGSPRCVDAFLLDLPCGFQGAEFNLLVHVLTPGIEPDPTVYKTATVIPFGPASVPTPGVEPDARNLSDSSYQPDIRSAWQSAIQRSVRKVEVSIPQVISLTRVQIWVLGR